jgi:hypothetical protein
MRRLTQESGLSTALAWMFAVMAAVCALFVLRAAISVADQVPYALDYNEGWNAYHAEAAVGGGVLYPSPPSFLYNNYPPLSFYVVGLLGKALGSAITAGRILSLLGALLTAGGLAWSARRLGCTRLQAGWGAGLFLTILLMDYDYAGMNDPQLLGHAFALAGLAVLLQAPRTTARLASAALLFSIAFFIKQNLFILPLASALWLLLYERRNGVKLVLCGAVLGLAGAGLFQLAYATSLWSELNPARSYDWGAPLRGLAGWLELSAIPALAALSLPRWFGRDRHIVFCLLYFILALAAGTFFYGGAGVAGNVFFDALIALALSAAVGVNRFLAAGRKKPALVFALCQFVPLMAGLTYLAATDSIYPRYWLEPRAPARLQAARDIAFLKGQDGPVMCSLLSLCYWAGKPAEMDIGLTGQALKMGRRDPAEVAAPFAAEKFAALQLTKPPALAFEDDGTVGRAILAHYRLDHADMYGLFYVRKPP